MNHRFSFLLLLLAASGCGRESYFQPDARLVSSPLPASADSARVTAGRHYQRGPLGRLLLGPHYRRAWATPVTLPVLPPATAVPGGLRFGKMGGGFQTTSMTLVAPDGRGYALRSIDKDPYRTLPKALRQGFVLTTVRDATSAGMPYGAFVVPPLAEAAGVPHTNPRPFYVRPDEQGLGPASERVQGKVVLLEEKMEGRENIAGRLPGAQQLEESDGMLAARFANPRHAIDEEAFLRARLLDIWLGDWDRHEGQWTWAAYAQPDGRTLWRPIPQDRDQVFFRFDDGVISWVVSRLVSKFRTFGPRYESIEGYTRNARFIDERALASLPRTAYQRTARDLQQRLTDAVIGRAVRQGLPPEVYTLEGPQMEAALRARRDALPEAAEEFYQLQARRVLVAGTDQDERFVVERLNDTATVVSVYRVPDEDDKKATRTQLLYRRSFNPRDTRTVVLRGLEGKDEFIVRGQVRRSPFIDIYGGPHEDTVQDSSRVAGLRKRTRFFDSRRNNVLEAGPETKDRTEHHVLYHAFDRDGSGR
ncbi:hypothetical protein [Hymenobacter weizhouensis]|uniref:hypothetical protein n=1 Tax=Hymenobacter sp. YIM 151500-1 TaxID=2987689 RepID=UPI0022271F26|nr:hypothetical protein [Hymenobacter sp. YIM 151500-1]UYZ64155.1 hypothetical protein OIS53_04740 [Hymenobacter sp. YIM 151500-1]